MKFSFPHHIDIMPEPDFTKEIKLKFLKPTWNYKVFKNFTKEIEGKFENPTWSSKVPHKIP